jgi:hypothetical protein
MLMPFNSPNPRPNRNHYRHCDDLPTPPLTPLAVFSSLNPVDL